MNFDEVIVKESPGICRCCLSEGCYKDLGSEYTWMNETEVYADMLLDCFDISISQHNEGPNGPKRLICEVCITRLRDACNFKKQVVDSEKRFIDMLARGEFKNKVLVYGNPARMKQESQEDGEPEEIVAAEVEYLDDMEFGPSDDEIIKIEKPIKFRQSTSKASTSEEPTPKGKRGRPKKEEDGDSKPKKRKLSKGDTPSRKASHEAKSKSSITANERNRLMKENATKLLENTTVLPFKWQRKQYLCFYCHLRLTTMEEVRQHTYSEHKKSNTKSAVSILRRDDKVKVEMSDTQCKLCGQTILNFNAIVDHLKSVHGLFFNEGEIGVIPYRLFENCQCAICNETFPYFVKLNQHMNKHFRGYICELCGKSFLSNDRLRCHSLSHGSKFHCTMCFQSFDSLTQKNLHSSTVHDKPKLIKCDYCSEVFKNYARRKSHYKLVHSVEIPEYKCPDCGKIFPHLSKMMSHFKEVHERERNFACTLCDSKFFSRTHVKKHMVRHLSDKLFQCDVCKKTYSRNRSLKAHLLMHKIENTNS